MGVHNSKNNSKEMRDCYKENHTKEKVPCGNAKNHLINKKLKKVQVQVKIFVWEIIKNIKVKIKFFFFYKTYFRAFRR